MSSFFGALILTSPYKHPAHRALNTAREATLVLHEGNGLPTEEQQYDATSMPDPVPGEANPWRAIPNPSTKGLTPVEPTYSDLTDLLSI